MYGGFYPRSDVDRLYVSRDKGCRSLMAIARGDCKVRGTEPLQVCIWKGGWRQENSKTIHRRDV